MRGTGLIVAGVLTLMACVMPGPAGATAPGQNGNKIAFSSGGDIFVMSPDGSGVINLTNTPFLEHDESQPAWSPDGTQITFVNRPDDDARAQQIWKINADGSGRAFVGEYYDEANYSPDWSPGGDEIAFGSCAFESGTVCVVAARKPDGSAPRQVVGADAGNPSWSPDGKRIAVERNGTLHVANSDGTNVTPVTVSGHPENEPDWSPDGSRIVFFSNVDGDYEIYSIEPDGSDLVQLTQDPAFDLNPSWSPDGSKLLFDGNRDGVFGAMYSMNPDGSDVTRIGTALGSRPVWQPIPINAYPRPKGASPTRVSLVPAYEPCASPDRTHGPPLAFPSCNPPSQEPGQLTVGSPDANGQPAKSVSYLRVNPLRGNPSTPADEADVRLRANINDVRLRSDLSDYSGDLEARLTIKITDRDNTPHPGSPGAATVQQFTHSAPIACTATANTTVGSTCELDTTVEALVPGAVTELTRAIWELGAIRVHDVAGDLFLTQGVFVP